MFLLFSFPPQPPPPFSEFVSQNGANEWERGGRADPDPSVEGCSQIPSLWAPLAQRGGCGVLVFLRLLCQKFPEHSTWLRLSPRERNCTPPTSYSENFVRVCGSLCYASPKHYLWVGRCTAWCRWPAVPCGSGLSALIEEDWTGVRVIQQL